MGLIGVARTDMLGSMKAGPPRQLASDEVLNRLRGQILSGELSPGDPLPSERSLSEQLGINRHAIREAVKRLQQAGLVRVSQGGATRVLDWPETAGLDLLLDLMGQAEEPPAALIGSVLEMRASIGVDVARRCAERAGADERAAIAASADAVATLIDAGSSVPVAGYGDLWELIVAGSENLAYRLALNSLNAALAASPQLGEALVPRDGSLLRELGQSIGSGHGLAAAEVARTLLEADLELSPPRTRP